MVEGIIVEFRISVKFDYCQNTEKMVLLRHQN